METATLRLDANEGRPCMHAAALAALVDSEVLRRYPDPSRLEAALAARMGISPERVIATAGADDAIDRAIRSYGLSKATVLSTAPAFEEYAAAASRSGARYIAAPRAPDGPFPLAALVAAIRAERPAIVVVASPDNPGGGTISPSELRALAKESAQACSATVLLDAAYSDFDEDREVYDIAIGVPGVITTNTFSKAYGLAGLRAGWAAGQAEDIARLRRAGPPFAQSAFSVAAALFALESGTDSVEAFVAEVRRERLLLQAALGRIGARTWAGKANFVAAIVPDAPAFSEALAKDGIKIRSWPGKPGRENLIRITCPGDESEFRTLLAALERLRRLT